MGKRYITTPIYYAYGSVHIGNSYTTVVCDVLARYFRLKGEDVFYLTGMDEHGQKIQEAAEKRNITPKALADEVSEKTKKLWDDLKITEDYFIRTTDKKHEEIVAKVFEMMKASGDIYLGTYEGNYCVSCEAFFTKSQLDELSNCPDCHKSIKKIKEEAYFFKLEKYAKKLLKYIELHPNFILPETRRNEVVKFVESGLKDLCVSRTKFTWGVKVTSDPKHVIYVWVDALFNYLTALGFLTSDDKLYQKFWVDNDKIVHVLGKDILRFHAIYWPIFLMSIGVPIKFQLLVHGWILMKEGKMSKSVGNVVYPMEVVEKFGLDSLRYYLVKELSEGKDGIFTYKQFVERYNADLANSYGNLCQRTIKMGLSYFNGIVNRPNKVDPPFELLSKVNEHVRLYNKYMDNYQVAEATEIVNLLVNDINKFIDLTTPWALAKDPEKKKELEDVIYYILEGIKIASRMYEPILVETKEKITKGLGLNEFDETFGSTKKYTLTEIEPLFKRIDKKEYEDEDQRAVSKHLA